LPSDPGTQHEQSAGKRAAVIKPFPTGMAEASFRTGNSGLISRQSSSSSSSVAIENLLGLTSAEDLELSASSATRAQSSDCLS
jgi:hypothetical protein